MFKLMNPSAKTALLMKVMPSSFCVKAEFDELIVYIDYLEGVARDFHLQGNLIARALGGAIPERGTYGDS